MKIFDNVQSEDIIDKWWMDSTRNYNYLGKVFDVNTTYDDDVKTWFRNCIFTQININRAFVSLETGSWICALNDVLEVREVDGEFIRK